MKLTVAVLALLSVCLSAAPVMALATESGASNSGYQATHHRHHHHHRRHHKMDDTRSGGTQNPAIV
ncbi:MAG TPA: hypothetical protein VNZ06_07415 [Steroidobacteraceae bacterium]|jgi:hypothetical protein|nr:hypothetical protein [Steroidobacteraceae bacterium]